jgi:cytohesin
MPAQATTAPATSPEQAHKNAALHAAIAAGDIEAVKKQLADGADPRSRDKKGVSAVRRAADSGNWKLALAVALASPDVDAVQCAASGDIDGLKLALAANPDYFRRKMQLSGPSPLRAAMAARQAQAIKVIIEADPEGWSGFTPLHSAAWSGDVETVKFFVESGIDINPLDKERCGTPLHQAVCNGSREIIDMLIKAGADPHARTDENWTALDAAAWRNNTYVLKKLLALKADPNVVRGLGWRAIHSALWAGSDDAVKLLLEYEENSDAAVLAALGKPEALKAPALPDAFNQSVGPHPAWWAARCGQLELLKEYVKKDRNLLAAKNCRQYNLLQVAAEAGRVEVVKWLIAQGMDVSAGGALNSYLSWCDGCTAMHLAATTGQMKMIEELLSMGVEVDAATSGGKYGDGDYTPLGCAAENGKLAAVKLLIERGATVDANCDGGTPLGKAAAGGHMDVVKHLIKVAAKVDGSPGYNSPLARAIRGRHKKTINYLLAQGADVNSVDGNGTGAMSAAVGNGDIEMVKLLLSKGAKVEDSSQHSDYMETALGQGNSQLAWLLIEHGWRPRDLRAGQIMVRCGLAGDTQLMVVLIAQGLGWSAGEYSHNGLRSTFDAAIVGDHTKMVRKLISMGASPVDQLHSSNKNRPLHVAARNGSVLAAAVLLEAGAEVDALGDQNQTPLTMAAKANLPAMIELLLAHGATPDYLVVLSAVQQGSTEAVKKMLAGELASGSGASPVDLVTAAVGADNVEMLKMLIEQKMPISELDRNKRLPLNLALTRKDQAEAMVKTLLAAGADPAVKDEQKHNALHAAVVAQRYDLAELILARVAKDKDKLDELIDLHLAAALGKTDMVAAAVEKDLGVLSDPLSPIGMPLAWAAHANQLDIVRLLLKKGAAADGIHPEKRNYQTPLYWAACRGNDEVIKALLKAKAGVDAKAPSSTLTPLWGAVCNARRQTVQLLLDDGADPDVEGPSGWRPLHVAANMGEPELAEMLLLAGADLGMQDGSSQTPLDVAAASTWYGSIFGEHDRAAHQKAKLVSWLLPYALASEDPRVKGSLVKLLFWAAKEHDVEVTRRLLEAGVDADGRPSQPRELSPLMWAISRACHARPEEKEKRLKAGAEIVALLIKHGADIDYQDGHGRTARTLAKNYEFEEAIKLLDAGRPDR